MSHANLQPTQSWSQTPGASHPIGYRLGFDRNRLGFGVTLTPLLLPLRWRYIVAPGVTSPHRVRFRCGQIADGMRTPYGCVRLRSMRLTTNFVNSRRRYCKGIVNRYPHAHSTRGRIISAPLSCQRRVSAAHQWCALVRPSVGGPREASQTLASVPAPPFWGAQIFGPSRCAEI